MDYDVLIIGAGPGGIFTAYELTSRARKPMKVGVFELGNPLDKRMQNLLDHERVRRRRCILRREIQYHQ